LLGALDEAAEQPGRCYLTGGATAVLLGWRATTVDVAQALSKLERDHARDREDVRALVASGLVQPARLLAYFDEIEPSLYRFPAIDPAAFRARVESLAPRDVPP